MFAKSRGDPDPDDKSSLKSLALVGPLDWW